MMFLRHFLRRPRPPRRMRPRRPVARRPARPPLPPQMRQELQTANRLLDEGRPAEAAPIFGRVSDAVAEQGMFVRAADLSLAASRAHFAAGEVDLAVERVQRGVRLLMRAGLMSRARRVVTRAEKTLQEAGYAERAEQLENWAAQVFGEGTAGGPPTEEERGERRGTLPARCPGCGASLIPDEVEWHDSFTAECPYCGTLVKTISP